MSSAITRHSILPIAIPILAALITLATSLQVSYSSSPIQTWTAGFPLPWKTTTLAACDTYTTQTLPGPTAQLTEIPCPAIYESAVNWLYVAADILIYTTMGYALLPVLGNLKTRSSRITVLAGILATILTSIPTLHEELGTGNPTKYDRHGVPFPWLTFVTGNILCGPGFNCPTASQLEFSWVSLAFNLGLYFAIASVAMTILRARLFRLST